MFHPVAVFIFLQARFWEGHVLSFQFEEPQMKSGAPCLYHASVYVISIE